MRVFNLGDPASRSQLAANLDEVHALGQSSIDALGAAWTDTLGALGRGLSSLNGRRQRASEVLSPSTLLRFSVDDFGSIDQMKTTATVRIDAGSASLKERSTPIDAVVRSLTFASDIGTTQGIDNKGQMWQVAFPGSQLPTGTFLIELADPVASSLIVFDISATPSEPTIKVEVSANGISYQAASQVALAGYRVTAWLQSQTVRFVRVTISPTHPDNLHGTVCTFGLTSFTASDLEFHLRSEVISRPMAFSPSGSQVAFLADQDDRLAYFVAFNGGASQEVHPGDVIDLPAVTALTSTGVTFDPGTGVLSVSLPAGVLAGSLIATDEITQEAVAVAPGLDPADSNKAYLNGRVIAVNGTVMTLVRADLAADAGHTFKISYVTSLEPSITAQLRIVLSTEDRTQSPLFRSASLEAL